MTQEELNTDDAKREIWRANLNLIAGVFKLRKDFAEATEMRTEYFYQLLSGSRKLGSSTVRKIERKLNLPLCWLDEPRDAQDVSATVKPSTSQSTGASNVESHILRECIEDVFAVADDEDLDSAANLSRVIVALYESRVRHPVASGERTKEAALMMRLATVMKNTG